MTEEQLKQETLGWLADIGEPVAVPTKTLASAFDEMIGRIQQTIAANHRQAQTLVTLRDAVLPRLSPPASALSNGSRNTLKQHFRALAGPGHLGQHGAGRGVWYELR